MKRAVQHDTYDSVKRVGRELFGASNEIAGGVVDERMDFSELLLRFSRGSFDGAVVANIARGVGCLAAPPENLVTRFAKRVLTAAHEEYPRSQFGKPQSHGAAESGASAGEKDSPGFEQIALEHVSPPCRR